MPVPYVELHFLAVCFLYVKGEFVLFLQILGVLILAALVGLTYYFDKKHEHALCSASFVGLIVYTLIVSAFMSF